MSLPPVAAGVAADAVAALPARLRARLDAAVEQARGWPVESGAATVVVRPDEQTTVTLTTPVAADADAVCSCLLAPRCLHRAAVLNAAPILGPGPETADVPAEPAVETPSMVEANADQRDAARVLRSAAAALLTAGISGTGAVAQADLLRAVHQARAVGLHAAASAAVEVVELVRAARRDDPAFRLGDVTDRVRELLVACHRVAGGDGAALGVPRRDYEPVGDLRLYGLFCEPVRAATGHAGAATYLADATGRVWVVSDVKPVAAGVTVAGTASAVDLGEVRLSHHDLSRAGLLAVNAHASSAGRLSHGRARQAVAAPGASWSDPALDGLWQAPAAEQADRWLAAASLPVHDRRAADDLAFLDGLVAGADRGGLIVVTTDGLLVTVAAPHEDPALPYVANLRQLSTHATGHPVRLIGRFLGARRVAGLALAAPWLPDRHGGHLDLGAARLTRADLPDAAPLPIGPAAPAPVAPLHLVRHHLERVVATGRAALLSGVDKDAYRLTAAHLGTGASVLRGLGAAGIRRTRDTFGRLDPHDADLLAEAWLGAAVYEQAATREVIRSTWQTR
ncbi:hypothetical protein [Hamadaea tsunoensis]|uniref:hypothetical protein n=1 Tax=Hamadaea tsunoensis TaxID=53368 RepID=UPI0003FDD16F|nr:hypothetical protein [Hamadaea tsunoensis]